MKNKEKYYEEILKAFIKHDGCNFKNKYVFKRNRCENMYCCECIERTNEWLEAEYKEPIRLTKNEKAILESLDDKWKWIARDEQDNGLVVFPTKPKKEEAWWSGQGCCDLMLFNHLFSFIKWEDSEPYSIEELLKCEVADDE